MRKDELPIKAHGDVRQIVCNYSAEEIVVCVNHESLVRLKAIQSSVQDAGIENFVFER